MRQLRYAFYLSAVAVLALFVLGVIPTEMLPFVSIYWIAAASTAFFVAFTKQQEVDLRNSGVDLEWDEDERRWVQRRMKERG